ncbi:TonB-dependent receptor plug domain-containing protein [Frateuria defendens]|uniref:TonB-dependent receptor plug domain-containing protein n=1 Tax=Frateuria defendens TaxID=2219559 RepID=UPI00066FDDA4|nr:TonB-dependent receptor [Frateuria defendens]
MKKRLFVAIGLALQWGGMAAVHAAAVPAQDAAPPSDGQGSCADPLKKAAQQKTCAAMAEHADKLDVVAVTGSLLPASQSEGASPTLTLDAAQIKQNGFATVAEALRATPFATGGVRDGSPIGSGNTQNAKVVSLFGLSPSFTKVLINGHPVANYPLTYNTGGGGNITDLANIPMAMVDHIDILPGNQSAIYGSDAIAGVVNIVLKKDVKGIDLNVRVGNYTQGGGFNRQAQLVGGFSNRDTRVVYALQWRKSNPVYGTDRRLTKYYPYDDDAYAQDSHDNYIRPADGCRAMGGLFGGSVADAGDWCASPYAGSYTSTFVPASKSVSGYLSVSHDFTPHLTAYADADYTVARNGSNAGTTYFYDTVTSPAGEDYFVSREFAPEETGGRQANFVNNSSNQYDLTAGLRGGIGESKWNYDLYYVLSEYRLSQSAYLPVMGKMEAYLNGLYGGNIQNVFVPLTPDQYAAFADYRTRRALTWTQSVYGKLTNTELFQLPGGAAGLAVLAEGGKESWRDQPEPDYVNGLFQYGSQQPSLGKRNHGALTAELDLPLWPMLTATFAGRYDRFSYSGVQSSKPTWKAGLQFRPFDSLLIRGSYSTAFRAPDLAYLYTGTTVGRQNTYDLYRCDQLGVSRTSSRCRYVMGSTVTGNLGLKPTTAKSWTVGAVWSPSDAFSLHADYLRIGIQDEIRAITVPTILADEASCRAGGTAAVLPGCGDAIARVQRDPATGRIAMITGGYFNVAQETLATITAGADYRLRTEHLGQFQFSLNWNDMLRHKVQSASNQPMIDVLHNPTGQVSQFKSIVNASANWTVGPVSTTLFAVRYGRTPNLALAAFGYGISDANRRVYGDPGHTGAWTVFNASVSYQLPRQMSLGLYVNNLFDRDPPHKGWVSYPRYNSQVYNALGRAVSLEFNKHFD